VCASFKEIVVDTFRFRSVRLFTVMAPIKEKIYSDHVEYTWDFDEEDETTTHRSSHGKVVFHVTGDRTSYIECSGEATKVQIIPPGKSTEWMIKMGRFETFTRVKGTKYVISMGNTEHLNFGPSLLSNILPPVREIRKRLNAITPSNVPQPKEIDDMKVKIDEIGDKLAGCVNIFGASADIDGIANEMDTVRRELKQWRVCAQVIHLANNDWDKLQQLLERLKPNDFMMVENSPVIKSND